MYRLFVTGGSATMARGTSECWIVDVSLEQMGRMLMSLAMFTGDMGSVSDPTLIIRCTEWKNTYLESEQ